MKKLRLKVDKEWAILNLLQLLHQLNVIDYSYISDTDKIFFYAGRN